MYMSSVHTMLTHNIIQVVLQLKQTNRPGYIHKMMCTNAHDVHKSWSE